MAARFYISLKGDDMKASLVTVGAVHTVDAVLVTLFFSMFPQYLYVLEAEVRR